MSSKKILTVEECDKLVDMVKIMQLAYNDPSDILTNLGHLSDRKREQHNLNQLVELVNNSDKVMYELYDGESFGSINLKTIMNNTHNNLITFESFDNYVQIYTFVNQSNDLIIALRGSDSLQDAYYDIRCRKVQLNQLKSLDCEKIIHNNIYVHYGFAHAIDLMWAYVTNIIAKYHEAYHNNIIIVGHSLGAAISTLCGYLIKSILGHHVIIYTAGSPAIGNHEFVTDIMKYIIAGDIKLYNMINVGDTIIAQPPELFRYRAIPCSIVLDHHMKTDICTIDHTYGRNTKYMCWTLWDTLIDLIYKQNIDHYLIIYFKNLMNAIMRDI